MSRLVVQHPALADDAVRAIADLAGAPPAERRPALARW